MRTALLIGFLFLHLTSSMAQQVYYTGSDAIIANPERGLQKYSITDGNYNTSIDYSSLDLDTLIGWRTGSDKVTVLFRYFLLDNFLTTNISQTYLDNIQNDFEIIRNAGVKCIIRFSYNDVGDPTNTIPQQPNLSRILTHITQLTPILQANKDVIVSHQAGFIGTWGEWYYTNSTEFGTEGIINPTQWQNRKDVLDAMLVATPAEIPIQVRYDEIKSMLYPGPALTPATAYQNTPQARIGFFNDAFLNKYGDNGTYLNVSETQNPVGTAAYSYLANESLYTPMSGETNGQNSPRTNADTAVFELDSVNWSMINRDFDTSIWNIWIGEDSYDKILQNLGYRFVLQSSEVWILQNGSGFNLLLNIANAGYARPFKQRTAYLVMKNTLTNVITTHPINSDVRTWQEWTAISQDFSATESGTYQLYLWLPDSDPSLSTNSAYSIQCANTDTWDAATGYNDLLQTVTLTVGIDETQLDHQQMLYPNPATHEITIPFEEIKKVELLNSMGELIEELHVSMNHTINVSELADGVYYIRLADEKGTYRFLKQ